MALLLSGRRSQRDEPGAGRLCRDVSGVARVCGGRRGAGTASEPRAGEGGEGGAARRLPFAMPGFRMTRRFFERLAALCMRLPVQAVAKMATLSRETVARVDLRAIALGLGDRTAALTDLRWIAVDEVSRPGRPEYCTS